MDSTNGNGQAPGIGGRAGQGDGDTRRDGQAGPTRKARPDQPATQTVRLAGAAKLLTRDPRLGYRVLQGRVGVALVPQCPNAPTSQLFLAEVGPGFTVPALDIQQPLDGRPCVWRLLLCGADEALVETVALDDASRARAEAELLAACGQAVDDAGAGGAPAGPALAEALPELYRRRSRRRRDAMDAFERRADAAYERNLDTLASPFRRLRVSRRLGAPASGSPLYDALALACRRQRIDLPALTRLREVCGEDFTVEDAARVGGFVCRRVRLQGASLRDIGPVLAFDAEGRPRVYMAGPGRSARLVDPVSGGFSKIAGGDLPDEAYVFHRPFGSDRIDLKEVLRFSARDISVRDAALVLVNMLLVTVLGTQAATFSALLYDVVIPLGEAGMLLGVGLLFASFMLASLCFSIVQRRAAWRLTSRLRYSLQAAIYQRVFHLPEKCYRSGEAAETAYRVTILSQSYLGFFESLLQVGLQGAFSVAYLAKMLTYSPQLSAIGSAFLLVDVAATVAVGFFFRRFSRKRSQLTGKLRSFLYQCVNGIATIRVAGAERDALGAYMGQYAELGLTDYDYGTAQRVSTLLGTFATGGALVAMYAAMGSGLGVSMGGFMGFTTAFALFSAGLVQVASGAMNAVALLPVMRDAMGVLRFAPERNDVGACPRRIAGAIDVEHVSFAYSKAQGPVLRDVSLHVGAGEYVAIVGGSGCGKSTLLRLLLGFETPASGKVSYDGVDFSTMNKPEFRRKAGVVLQDGGLVSGSIRRNVQVARPGATDRDVARAIEAVGLTADVAAMPMGLDTLVSEEARTVSGGQKQRILLARALVGDPQILFLDEATSSLDNVSQAQVVASLAKLQVTRVVVAHRLSTVMGCDRIFVMERGTIVESGTFEELMARKGRFYELARTQMT